jgi:hypothetical protein
MYYELVGIPLAVLSESCIVYPGEEGPEAPVAGLLWGFQLLEHLELRLLNILERQNHVTGTIKPSTLEIASQATVLMNVLDISGTGNFAEFFGSVANKGSRNSTTDSY